MHEMILKLTFEFGARPMDRMSRRTAFLFLVMVAGSGMLSAQVEKRSSPCPQYGIYEVTEGVYKSSNGDIFDSNKNTYRLANGETGELLSPKLLAEGKSKGIPVSVLAGSVACTAQAVSNYKDQSTHPADSPRGTRTNKKFQLHDKVQINLGGNWLDGEIVRMIVEPPAQDVTSQEAFCSQFLDENGGYTSKSGGRFDVMAGTYTTKEGSIRDQYGWQYPDGSYRNSQGDFYEASIHRFHFANGQVLTKPKVTAEQGKQALQELARDYPKDYFSIAIAQRVAIMKEHPAEAAAFYPIDGMLYQVRISGNRMLWTISQNLRPVPATPAAAPKPVRN